MTKSKENPVPESSQTIQAARCSFVVERLLMVQWVIGLIPHERPKGYGMCYPVCGMMHINELLLLIQKSNPCSGGIRFPLSELSFTI